MSTGLLEWFSGTQKEKEEDGFGIAPGVVTDNFNVLSEARVQVHMSAFPDMDPWARVVGIGGGSGRGFLWVPQIDDEVLVPFNKNDHRDAYIIGGLWSTLNRPPALIPTDFVPKRILQTGLMDSPLGHSIVFDDALQSITITTSTQQTIKMSPTQIQIGTVGGVLQITLGVTPPGIQIQATAGNLSLSAPAGNITITGANVSIQSTGSTSISSSGIVSVAGSQIMLN